MAIDQISAGDSGLSVRTKLNQAIGEANKVGGKAESSALTAETQARQQTITSEANARQQADEAEAQARQQADAAEAQARAAGDNLRVTYAEASSPLIRPGEANRFFTADLDGQASAVNPLPDGAKAVTDNGSVAVVSGAGTVAPIAAWRAEPGRQYRVRFVFRRAVDTEDPANDAIRMGLRWLKKDKSGLSTTILADILDVTQDSGRLEYFFNFAAVNADTIDATAPAGAVYVRPFVKAFGSGVTHVEVIEVTDLSNAVEFAPDVSEFRRQLAGFDYRLESFTDRIDVAEENIFASQDAGWFIKGTLDDARLSDNVMLLALAQTVTADKTFVAPLRMRAELMIGDGQATGEGATARIIGDGNYFAIAPTNLAGGFNTLKEWHFNPDGDGVWTAEGGFKTTGNLVVVGSGSFTDAGTTRSNLDVYSTGEVDTAIEAEAAAREAADTMLQASIDAEAAARAAADADLQQAIDDEASTRASADSTLNDAIDDEADARAAADSALQSNIDAETTARSGADTALQDNIDTEATTRTDADTLLQNNIDNEETARIAGDAALQVDVDLKATSADPVFTGTVALPAAVNGAALPVYADDAAAGTDGLTAGHLYATATGELRIKL